MTPENTRFEPASDLFPGTSRTSCVPRIRIGSEEPRQEADPRVPVPIGNLNIQKRPGVNEDLPLISALCLDWTPTSPGISSRTSNEE